MQLLYFLPDFPKAIADTADLDAIGLGHVHDGHQPMSTRDLTFEGGAAGLFATAAEAVVPVGTVATLGYDPAKQTWRPGPRRDGKPLYHVGYWTDRRPTAESLVRQKPLGGSEVTLRDGGTWQVPIAYAKFGHATLPRLMEFDDASQGWRGRIAPEYDVFCGQVARAYDWLTAAYFDETKPSINYGDAMAIVTAALGFNYRVGPLELSVLQCVGSAEMWRVLEAAADWPSLMQSFEDQASKKEAAASA